MTREELAAELYDLIVVRGRRRGRPQPSSLFDNDSYDSLPEWMQDMWLMKADEFAMMNNFDLVESR